MEILNLQIEIFLLLFIGYILSKLGLFSKTTRAQLTSITLSVILPAAIIESFDMDLTFEVFQSTIIVLVVSLCIQILYFIFNKFLYNKYPSDKKINLKYSTMVSNAGFMGMPIAQATFGNTGLLYASIFLIPQRIFMWSEGLSLYTTVSKKDLVKNVLTHPCIIALFIGVIVMCLRMVGITMPAALDNTIQAVANCNTAISMIVIGGILSDVTPKEFIDVDAFYYSLIRLILLPIIIFIIVRLIGISPLAANVCVLLSAMPAASTSAMLAQKYEVNPEFASKLVFVSTLLSLITIPLITIILKTF
ncbi:MAG: AEC family transporter [Thomasclavelia sp.]|nr:AEC family transporter [Thomasclavelia sp.]